MSDAAPRRRILVQGLSLDQVRARLQRYEQLDDPGDATVTLTLRGPTAGGWVQLDLPADLAEFHAFNLTKWLEGDDEDPQAPGHLMLVQQGGPVSFWAKPATADGGSSVVAGRTDDHKPFAYDLSRLQMVDDARFDAPPMSVAMALRTSGVPASLQPPDAGPEPLEAVPFRPFTLDGDGASPLVMKVLGWLFGGS